MCRSRGVNGLDNAAEQLGIKLDLLHLKKRMWMEQDILLSEISQAQKDTCVVSLIHGE